MQITYIFIILLLISGCSSINASPTPYQEWMPPEYYDAHPLEDDSQSFIRSEKPDIDEPLTLARLLDIALKNNPATRQAWEESRAKQAILEQEQSQLYPKVTVSADGLREKSIATLESENINDLKYGPSGKAELLLFDFGGRDAEIAIAYHDMLSSGFQFNQSLQDLILDVEQKYYGLDSASSGVEAAEADVIDAKASFEAAELRFQVGLVSKLDRLQAGSSYENALYDLEEAKFILKTTRAGLATTLGYSADIELNIVKPDKKAPTDINKQDVSEMIDEALLVRPDIQAARAALQAKAAAVKDASSSLWPHVNLGGTMGHNWYKYYNQKRPRNDDYSYTGYLSLEWDIFDGFYNINKKLEAEAEQSAQRARLIELELEMSADVWSKYYNYNTAVRKLKFSEAFLNSSKASYDLAFEGYGAGLKDMLDLLQGQSALSEARAKFVNSRKDLFVAVAELAHATGTLKAGIIEKPEE